MRATKADPLDQDPPLVLDPTAERLDQPGVLDFSYPIVQDYPTPEPILTALREAVAEVHRYPHRERQVREALAEFLGRQPEEILPTVGANGGLDLVSRTWLAGRKVLLPEPAFWQLADAPRRYGAELIRIELETAGLETSETQDLLQAFDGAEAILLCSPNNPLGTTLAPELLDALLDRADGRPVIVDESYADMAGYSAAGESLHPDLILVRGFKTFTIPGARIGYVVAQPARIRQLSFRRPPFEANVLAEAAVLAAMQHRAEIEKIWQQVRGDLRYLEKRLLSLGGTIEPSGTLFTCWRHPRARLLGKALAAFKVFAISAERPVILGMPEDALRFTARKRETVDQMMSLLGQVLPLLPPAPEERSSDQNS